MKRLSKIILIITLTAVSVPIFAQTCGIRGGLNMAYASLKDEYGSTYNKPIVGFNLGGTIKFELTENYSIETGLTLNYKGFKLPVSGGTDTVTNLLYLDIPINLKYGFNLKENKLNLIVGPYIGLGITGLSSYKVDGEKNGEKVKWGNSRTNDDFRRLDYGINLGAEYEFGALGVGLQYGLGLANIMPHGDSGNSQRNRLLSIYLAYKFGKK